MYSKFIEEFVGHIYVVNWWGRGSSRELLFDEKEELKELVYISCFSFYWLYIKQTQAATPHIRP